jgi:hypothetical protein
MEAGSLTIAKVDQGRRDVRTLLAVAEAQQFSLGQDWPAGPLLTQVPPCSIGRPTVSTSRSDSSRSAYAESGTAPVASNTELKKQRGAAASTTSRMSTPEGPRSRSGFSSASLMSAGEAATLRANSPMAACSGSVDSSLAVSGSRLDPGHYFGGLGSAEAADLPSARFAWRPAAARPRKPFPKHIHPSGRPRNAR